MPIRPEKLGDRHRLVVRRRTKQDDVPNQASYVLDVYISNAHDRTIPIRGGAAEFWSLDRQLGDVLKTDYWSEARFPTLPSHIKDAALKQLTGLGTQLLGLFAQNRSQHSLAAGWEPDDYQYLRDFLGGLRANDLLYVEGSSLPICWHFIYLGGHFVQRADLIDGFLGARCRVVIEPSEARPPPGLTMVGATMLRRIVGGPNRRFGFIDDDQVQTAHEHRQYLSSWLGKGFEPLHATNQASLQDADELARYLTHGGRHAAHFICHGVAQHRSSASHEVRVRHGVMVPTQDLLNAIDKAGGRHGASVPGKRSSTLTQRLISIHVCESSLPTEPPDQQSFVEGLVKRGAHAGVGVVAQICEGNARSFMTAFYDALQAHNGVVGEAFSQALRGELASGNPGFLNYVLVGDPEARL